MRALGLCLLSALCLNVFGCANPGQPPSLDPFVGRTTVPPPGTGLAAPTNPYIQPGATGVAPQSRAPSKRTQAAAETMEDETGTGWRGAETPKARLASAEEFDDTQVTTADAEFSANDDTYAETAGYEEDVVADDEPRANPVRKSAVTIRQSDEEGVEVGVER